jgi:hypothetical protein
MHKELLAHSPLLVLPLVAMFLFMAVWAVAAIRVMTRSQADLDEASRLPLGDDDDERR